MPKKIHLSYSAISCFKACHMRYYGQYVLGIRKIEDSEAQRIGTNWHSIMEIADDMDAVLVLLNERYGNVPNHMDKEKLEIERIKLLYTLTGYNWNYQNDDIEVIATEIPFEISVINPETGRALPNVINKGKIDRFIRLDGQIFVMDHKSTSNSVDPDSRLWKKLNLDTQMNNYVYAARRLQAEGKLEQYDITKEDTITGAYYDCWHKPGISPKKLSQGDSKKFVEDGMYCDQEFEVVDYGDAGGIHVNGMSVEVEPGAKEGTFAIRETPEMYGARLLAEIVAEPGKYFGRKELTKTDLQIERFEWELYNIYQNIKDMKRTGHWYGDESQCEATFSCDFIPYCYENKPITVEEMPEGLHCIFNKETDNGNSTITAS
jgi:hypothetical protein